VARHARARRRVVRHVGTHLRRAGRVPPPARGDPLVHSSSALAVPEAFQLVAEPTASVRG
jgi:hypothetical protein